MIYFRTSLLVLISWLACMPKLCAQLTPMGSQYYQNPYLVNPAKAGAMPGLMLNWGYRNLWTIVDGTPKNNYITAEYSTGKVGLGFNFSKDQVGLFDRNKLLLSYAYHLPINAFENQLSLGLSVGLKNERIDLSKIVGAPDATPTQYDNRENIVDADFGLAYNTKTLEFEFSINNMKRFIEKETQNVADYNNLYAAIGSRHEFSDWVLKPKVVYRSYEDFSDIVDLGLEIRTVNDQLGFMGIYHSSRNFTLGLSYQRNKQWQFLSLYSTPSKEFKRFTTRGGFEVGLRLNTFTPRNTAKEGLQ